MAKSNGSTRTSSSVNPTAVGEVTTSTLQNAQRIAQNMKFKFDNTDGELKDIKGISAFTERSVEKYANNGVSIPSDAVEITFGRGSLDGETARNVLQREEFKNIKLETLSDGTKYIHGYKSLEQLKEFSRTTIGERKLGKTVRFGKRTGFIK